MLARIAHVTRQAPAIVVFNGGTNDLAASHPLATLQQNHQAIVTACLAAGARVVRLGIPASTNFSPTTELLRMQFNAWLAGQTDITFVDLDPIFSPTNPAHTFDGTHPTALGARLIGDAVADALQPFVQIGEILFPDAAAATAAGSIEPDWDFAGIAGARSGASLPTGQVANGWSVINNTSAAVVCEKTSLRGTQAQSIRVSGSVASANTVILENTVAVSLLPGDFCECWLDVEITAADGVSAPAGIAGFGLQLGSAGSIFTSAPDVASGAMPLPLSGVLRITPAALSAGGASLKVQLLIRLAVGVVDAQILAAKLGVRRAELDAYGIPVRIITASPPAITGTPGIGQVLTASFGTWAGGGILYSVQWLRNGLAINGATSRTYAVQAADQGSSLTCLVTASNPLGSDQAVTSGVSIL
jgi:hypothetical protein